MKLEDRLRPYTGEMEVEWDTLTHGRSFSLRNEIETWEIHFRYDRIATANRIIVMFRHVFYDREHVLAHDFPLQSIRKEVTEWLRETSPYRLPLLLQDIPIVWAIHANIPYRDETHNLSINVLETTVQTYNVLTRDGYVKIGDLKRINKDYIDYATSLGNRGRTEIKKLMKEWGFSLCH